jgi:hypothetical protein
MKESIDGLAPSATSPAANQNAPRPADADGGPDGHATVLPIHSDEVAKMRAAFRLQLTDQLYEKASNRAEFEVAKARLRYSVIEDGADIVQGVLTDTFEGRLTWHHDACSLLQHVCDTARDRVRRLRERARHEVRIDALDASREGERGDVEHEIGEIQHHPGSDPVRAAALRDLATLAKERLWTMASTIGDEMLMKGLVALMAGARGPQELADVLVIDDADARRLWRRVRDLAERLPAELRDEALDLL